jgi:hypothetical protein
MFQHCKTHTHLTLNDKVLNPHRARGAVAGNRRHSPGEVDTAPPGASSPRVMGQLLQHKLLKPNYPGPPPPCIFASYSWKLLYTLSSDDLGWTPV